jgi:hypothetical protein
LREFGPSLDPLFPLGEEEKGFVMIPVAVDPSGQATVDPPAPE